MTILDTIIARKRLEVAERKERRPVATLEAAPLFTRNTLSLKQFVLDPSRTGIIAEFKRRSPSKGLINGHSSVADVTSAYARAGASGISVLTDTDFFGGSLDDLEAVAPNTVPLLRKDFTVDAYQLAEAKASGADAILLIAACLSPAEVKSLARSAKGLGLDVLLELHDETELGHLCAEVDLVGVNNRNLKTFTVDLEQSARLAAQIGESFVKVAESGIRSVTDIHYLASFGFRGFLVGENFMKQADPGAAFETFVRELNKATP